MKQIQMNNSNKSKHDIQNALSALLSSTELVIDCWEQNPELVAKLLPQMKAKIDFLTDTFDQYSKNEQ